MKRLIIFIAAVFVFSSFSAEISFPEEKKDKKKWVKSKTGLKSLMLLAKDRGQMIKEYKADTKSYKKIKKALNHDLFHGGEKAFEIKRKYGEPVVILQENNVNETRWVYKPSDASFFEGEKAYLFFDSENKLVKWNLVEGKPK